MSLSEERSYSIDQFRALLSQKANLDLSPIELTEILWLALQRSENILLAEPPETALPPSSPSLEPQVNVEPLPLEPQPLQPLPPTPSTASITIDPLPDEDTSTHETHSLPVKIPEAIALRSRREIGRAIRPLMRKVPSKARQEIDEAATVLQIAENQIWSPILKDGLERWLELAIVVERTNVLDVWSDSIAEFQHLMERHGAFRDVRTWQLQVGSLGKPELYLQTASGLKGKARSAKELRDVGGRRLILLLSDCTSRAWRSGSIPDLLKIWTRCNPVTIVQLLPEQYWDRSALKSGFLAAMRSRLPGPLSRDWTLEGLSLRRRRQGQQGLRIPVVTMRPDTLRQWAKALAATGDALTTGIVLDPAKFQLPEGASQSPSALLSAKQLVQQFRDTASAKAQELADMMAVLPVNWSVIRLIQKSMARQGTDEAQDTGALYLAEIFLSGLLMPDENVEARDLKQPAKQRYNFGVGVRDELLASIPISEARQVGDEIAEQLFRQLPQEIQQRVSEDIERRYGESLSYFEAFLVPDLPWGADATAEMLPFARVTGQVLRRWGGEYAELAQLIERDARGRLGWVRPLESGDEQGFAGFPDLETLEFTTAKLIEASDIWPPPLQTEEFTVAVISFEAATQSIRSEQPPFSSEDSFGRNTIKILILTANPRNMDTFRLDEEVREIREVLRRSQQRDQFEIVSRWAIRPEDLRRSIFDENPQIVHFSGRGAGNDGLALENDAGQLQLVSSAELSALFGLFKDTLECVVLNACFSEAQATAIHEHIDCVIVINQAISDRAAINFAIGFYDALGAGRSYEDAFRFGCNAINLEGILEGEMPVLKYRDRVLNPTSASHSVARLENAGGAMSPESLFYIDRLEDEVARSAIRQQGVTLLIKGPRQMGKTSLLIRVLDEAKKAGKCCAILNFMGFVDQEAIADADVFYRRFCIEMSRRLLLPDSLDEFRQGWVGNIHNCTEYMENYVLPELDAPLVLAMDEVNMIFPSAFRSEFFGMLRSWHEIRASSRNSIWKKLDLVLLISTDYYNLITNPNQSPFNAGVEIVLNPFTLEQVADCNQRHGSPLTVGQLQQLHGLLKGQPYLVHRALYLLASQKLKFEGLIEQAVLDQGPFGDHLRYQFYIISRDEDLKQGLAQVIRNNTCSNERVAWVLIAHGLIREEGRRLVPSCQLYADYFQKQF
jgi:AAA-like domain/CHAT domain